MPTQIRPYEADDLETCRSLWVDLTERHREIYADPTIGGDEPGVYFDEHLGAVGPENLWIADAGGGAIGLTGLIWKGRDCEVEPVVVHPAHRGQGVGRQLVETVIGVARERGARLLSVRPVARNADAIAFFRHAGFDILGHVELFMDFADESSQGWRDAPPSTLGGLRF